MERDYDILGESVSLWTQELMGLRGGLNLNYIMYQGKEDTSERDIPIIIKLVTSFVNDKFYEDCYFSGINDGRLDPVHKSPFIFIFFKTPIYVTSREFGKKLRKISTPQLEKLGISEVVRMTLTNHDYNDEQSVDYHPKIGLFYHFDSNLYKKPILEELSVWTQGLVLPPTKITFRISNSDFKEENEKEIFIRNVIRIFKINNYFVYLNNIFLSTDQPPSLAYYRFISPAHITQEKFLSMFKKYDTGALKRFTGNMDFLNTTSVGISDFNDNGAPITNWRLSPETSNLAYLPSVGLFRLVNFTQSEEVTEGYIENMKHLDEFNSFRVKRRPSLFRGKNPMLMLHCELNEARILAVTDFVKYLIGIGIEAKVSKTALEEEDYEIFIPDRTPIEDLIASLPDKPTGEDPVSTTSVSIWYTDDPENIASFTWGWGKGVYKDNILIDEA